MADAIRNDEGRVPAPERWQRIDRRSFLHGGLSGATAALLPAAVEETQAAPAPQRGTHGGGRRKLLTAPPDNSKPIQPSKATETWIEPWVWRPSDWPGEQLHLNVVENENPGPVVGFGNPNAVLFSYGGITPGPTIRMKGDEILFAKLRNASSGFRRSSGRGTT